VIVMLDVYRCGKILELVLVDGTLAAGF